MKANIVERVRCPNCGRAMVELHKRIIWPWQRLRGMKVRIEGTCPRCHVEASIVGWK